LPVCEIKVKFKEPVEKNKAANPIIKRTVDNSPNARKAKADLKPTSFSAIIIRKTNSVINSQPKRKVSPSKAVKAKTIPKKVKFIKAPELLPWLTPYSMEKTDMANQLIEEKIKNTDVRWSTFAIKLKCEKILMLKITYEDANPKIPPMNKKKEAIAATT
jgi:hypothetical protein